jgi:hypothetical protein
MRRPAIAVMFATTSGIVVPVASIAERSTSILDESSDLLGTMKTSSYVRSWVGSFMNRT